MRTEILKNSRSRIEFKCQSLPEFLKLVKIATRFSKYAWSNEIENI